MLDVENAISQKLNVIGDALRLSYLLKDNLGLMNVVHAQNYNF
jgi:hypothetical protein